MSPGNGGGHTARLASLASRVPTSADEGRKPLQAAAQISINRKDARASSTILRYKRVALCAHVLVNAWPEHATLLILHATVLMTAGSHLRIRCAMFWPTPRGTATGTEVCHGTHMY